MSGFDPISSERLGTFDLSGHSHILLRGREYEGEVRVDQVK